MRLQAANAVSSQLNAISVLETWLTGITQRSSSSSVPHDRRFSLRRDTDTLQHLFLVPETLKFLQA